MIFEIFKIKKGDKHYFHLIDTGSNGQLILKSQGYTSKAGAKKGIRSVQINAANLSHYIFQSNRSKKHYFYLKARNGEPIADSQLYASEADMESHIKTISKKTPKAKVIDTTI